MRTAIPLIDKEDSYLLEMSEIRYWSKYYTPQSPVKCFASVIGGAFVGAVPEVDVLALNRVIGLGLNGRIDMKTIDAIINFYKLAGVKRFFVQLSPFLKKSDTEMLLLSRGFKLRNRWAKLQRTAAAPIPSVTAELGVVTVSKSDAELYAEIIYNSFDWEDEILKDWLAQTVGTLGYRHYFATYKGKPVAAAALYVSREQASMAFAGTLREYRGLGAQGLLLRTRIQDAYRAGCRHIISETGENTPERPAASYRNMKRFGFEEAYLRDNWIFEF